MPQKPKSIAFLSLGIFLFLVGICNASTFKVLYTFGTSGALDAAEPYASLSMDKAGNLYGTTPAGGTKGTGTVFELIRSNNGTWKEKILYSFTNGADGGYPEAGVSLDGSGNIYGTTQQGGISNPNCGSGSCGVVFELVKANNWQETIRYSFTGNSDGAGPVAPLLLDSSGNIYGTTAGGGSFVGCYFGCGVAFELEKSNAWAEKVLHTFIDYPNDGADPSAGLIWDGTDLVGTTISGGVGPCCIGYDGGIIFQLTPNSGGAWSESILYTFCAKSNCDDGTMAWGGIVLNNGNMLGTTSNGGTKGGYGVLYERLTSGSTVTKFSFAGTGGENPIGPLVFRQGAVYGATEQGGTTTNQCAPFQNGNGVVYKLTQQSGKFSETVLHSFTGGTDGCIPQGNLIMDATGHLYGTTALGGKYGVGVAFEITP